MRDGNGSETLAALLIGWGVNVVALLVVDSIFDGVEIGLWGSVLIGAAVLGIANAIVKPILTLLALPLILLTLGLAYFAINVLMLAIAEWVAPDFSIDGFWTYIGATIVVWLVNWILSSALATLFGGARPASSSSATSLRTHERPRPADRRGRPAGPERGWRLLKGSQSMGAADEESDWDVVLVLLEGEPSQKRDGRSS